MKEIQTDFNKHRVYTENELIIQRCFDIIPVNWSIVLQPKHTYSFAGIAYQKPYTKDRKSLVCFLMFAAETFTQFCNVSS